MGGEGGSLLRAGALDGGARMKVVAERPDKIGDEQLETFFATLADTCNVVRSAKAAGMSANWAYRRRKVDATFRQNWAAALSEGYAKLEWVLLERAIKGTPKLVRTAKGSDRVMREYSTALAVALLRRHADAVEGFDQAPAGDEILEVRARILERLERIRDRGSALIDGKLIEGAVTETKGADLRSVARLRRLLAGWR
jgi:hypothetical protein